MQLCPSCNTPLPDKASFCAHCGYSLNVTENQAPSTTGNQAPPTSDKPEPSGTQEKNEQPPEVQAFSAIPNTPQPDEALKVEEPMTPIIPAFPDSLLSAKASNVQEETPPTSPDTPHPVPIDESDVKTALAFPASEETPLPVESATSASNEQPDLDPLPAATDEQPALDPLPVATDEQPALETLPVATDEQPALETLPVATDEQPALETLPAATNEQPTLETLPAATDEQPALETLPVATDEQPALATLTSPQASLPALPAANVEEPELETLASPKAPSSTSEPGISEQKTRALPPPTSTTTSNDKAEIAEQETLAVPIIPKASALKSEASKNNEHSLIEAQKTVSLATAEKADRSNPPGTQTQSKSDNDGTTTVYQEKQQHGNTMTQIRTALSDQLSKPAPKAVQTIGGLIWSLISPIFKRARDTEPEKPKAPLPQFMLLGWLPIIALTSAMGLFTTATAFNAARNHTPGAELYYWLGVGLIYIPVMVRLIMPYSSRAERVGLLCVVTLCLFLTKVSLSPLYYSGYDEFLHWRTINDILSSGHLFTKNPLLPVSPFYPGLEIVASALSSISGMTSIQAGFTVVGVANLTTILSLFLLAELLSGSARLASIAAVIYMANPHFLFFDTQFAYESLAIPLAMVVMFAMTRYETLKSGRPWVLLVAWTVLVALDLTHHATNFVFEGLFLLWAIVYLFLRPLPLRKSIVILTVIAGLTLTVTTILVIGTIVISYFTSFFADISSEVARDLGSAGSSSRQLFGGGAVIQTPLWERLISLGSVGLITLAIPFLLLCFWRRYRRNTLVWVFAIIIIFYPVLQVLRLTTSGAEISDRASAFIFIAISFLGAVAIVQFWPVRLFNWKHSIVISTAILVLFMGGIILGEGIPPTFMPGPYEVSADARSIDAEGIQAALWADTYLGPNKRMYTDRINQLLMSVYGDQYLVTKIGDSVDVTDVIFDPTFGPYEISRLQKGRVHYLAIDMRLSTQLPQDGFYYEQGESTTGPNGDTTAIDKERLTKFDGVPKINRLFDSGNLVIYDTGGIINAPAVP